MTRNTVPKVGKGTVRTRNVQPKHHDPYVRKQKVGGTMVCDGCGVVQHGGRWFWGEPPAGERKGGLCPACQRARDHAPAGTIQAPLRLLEPLAETRRMLREVEQAEKEEHPLERILEIAQVGDDLVVTTTGLHIARWLANKLQRQLHVKPDVHYDDEFTVRIEWHG